MWRIRPRLPRLKQFQVAKRAFVCDSQEKKIKSWLPNWIGVASSAVLGSSTGLYFSLGLPNDDPHFRMFMLLAGAGVGVAIYRSMPILILTLPIIQVIGLYNQEQRRKERLQRIKQKLEEEEDSDKYI